MNPFNRKPRTRHYLLGGMIHKDKKMTQLMLKNDSVRAILQPGEIVIPKLYSYEIKKYIKTRNLNIPL